MYFISLGSSRVEEGCVRLEAWTDGYSAIGRRGKEMGKGKGNRRN